MLTSDKSPSDSKMVCIHQPDFFPWLGFFDKIIRSDIFIILDHVQFPKKGGTYCNRVKILVHGKEQWVTAPIDRSYSGYKAITEMRFQDGVPWREKMVKIISNNYCKAPFYKETFHFFESLIFNPENNICTYNINSIKSIARLFNINTKKFFMSSQLNQGGMATEMLIKLTHAVGGDSYMCGSGAAGYQENEKFKTAGIKLLHRDYKHPLYNQFSANEFTPGLSIIDAFMNCGVSGVKLLLEP